jgi:NAD-dependent deacetylase
MDGKGRETARACAEAIRRARRIGVLSGAGMSTNAGIPDFRGPKGIYRTLGIENPESIFDIERFRRDPSFFYAFHREFLRILRDVTPTEAHRFLADLEGTGRLSGIVTQNIDALHQRAGSRRVLEIHGSVWTSRCVTCRKRYEYGEAERRTLAEPVPRCDCGGVLKPEVVFFGESVLRLEESFELAEGADLFLVLGSSLVVAPAAMLPARCAGPIVVVNRGEVSSAYLPPRRIALRAEEDLDEFFLAVREDLGADFFAPPARG